MASGTAIALNWVLPFQGEAKLQGEAKPKQAMS